MLASVPLAPLQQRHIMLKAQQRTGAGFRPVAGHKRHTALGLKAHLLLNARKRACALRAYLLLNGGKGACPGAHTAVSVTLLISIPTSGLPTLLLTVVTAFSTRICTSTALALSLAKLVPVVARPWRCPIPLPWWPA